MILSLSVAKRAEMPGVVPAPSPAPSPVQESHLVCCTENRVSRSTRWQKQVLYRRMVGCYVKVRQHVQYHSLDLRFLSPSDHSLMELSITQGLTSLEEGGEEGVGHECATTLVVLSSPFFLVLATCCSCKGQQYSR